MLSDAFKSIDVTNAVVQKLNHQVLEYHGVSADILRLDLLHPVISGNKWFKLKYYLQHAIDCGNKGIATFGGAWSNHLLATAYACQSAGLTSIGIIRGEEPEVYSSTLVNCEEIGMKLIFVPRSEYRAKEMLVVRLMDDLNGFLLVPEGGQGDLGLKGAAEIMSLIHKDQYDHILCSVGTGTTMKGILAGKLRQQRVIGISSLKLKSEATELASFIGNELTDADFGLVNDYHFGGYGKSTETLIEFMNQFYVDTGVPTDIVYTGKLCYALIDLVKQNHFPAGSRLCIIHSGGLQGNRSLPVGILCY